MRRRRFGLKWYSAGMLVALIAAMVPASPAGAANSCQFDVFPNAPNYSSELAIGCVLDHTTGAGTSYSIEDFATAQWHTGSGRQVVTTASTASGSKVITSSTAHFSTADINDTISGPGIASNSFVVSTTATTATLSTATTGVASGAKLTLDNTDGRTVTDATFSGTTITSATAHFCKTGLAGCGTKTDVGRGVSGTQIPHGTTISAVTNATTATLSHASTACPAGVSAANCKQVSLADVATLTAARQIVDATISGTTITSASAAFGPTDINQSVKCLGAGCTYIPAGDYITAVTNATTATLHVAGTSGSSKQLAIGGPSSSAPLNGEAGMELASKLAVNPALAAGLPSCSSGIVTGSNLMGSWENPGSFDTTGLGAALPNSKIKGPMVGQLVVKAGGGIAFDGFVVKVKAATSGESDALAHYDIVFPLLLTGVAICPGTATAPAVATTFRFFAESVNQSATASGNIRSLLDTSTASQTITAYEHIISGATTLATISGTCTEKFPATIDFGCHGN